VLQCVAVCCSVLQRVAACCSVLQCPSLIACFICIYVCAVGVGSLRGGLIGRFRGDVRIFGVVVCVLQCVAVCCSVLQCVAVCVFSELLSCHLWLHVAFVCVLQCVDLC